MLGLISSFDCCWQVGEGLALQSPEGALAALEVNLTNFQTSGLHLKWKWLGFVKAIVGSQEGVVSGPELAELGCLLEAVGAAGCTQAPASLVLLHCKGM